MPVSTSSVSAENPFEFVMENAQLVKQDEPSFAKGYETSSTHYAWCTRTDFVVLSWFRCGSGMVCSTFKFDSESECVYECEYDCKCEYEL